MLKYNNAPTNLLSGWDVLVVDDHLASQEVIQDILVFYGATVHLAENGAVGFDLAVKVRPRFIISDISMPEVDGWAFIEMLKADNHTKFIPVIALTAHAMSGDRELAISKGFHNYLPKPLDPFTFLSQILALLEDVDQIGLELNERMKV